MRYRVVRGGEDEPGLFLILDNEEGVIFARGSELGLADMRELVKQANQAVDLEKKLEELNAGFVGQEKWCKEACAERDALAKQFVDMKAYADCVEIKLANAEANVAKLRFNLGPLNSSYADRYHKLKDERDLLETRLRFMRGQHADDWHWWFNAVEQALRVLDDSRAKGKKDAKS
jgi:hypothetical protein